jgi:hypothetical protein
MQEYIVTLSLQVCNEGNHEKNDRTMSKQNEGEDVQV